MRSLARNDQRSPPPTVTIESATLYVNGGDQIFVTDTGTDALLRNLIVSDGAADGIEVAGGATAVSTFVLSWNHVAGADWNGITMGTGDFSMDPMFEDPDGAEENIAFAEQLLALANDGNAA